MVFTAASLFCGAGGLDIGFDHEGFSTLWANDFDSDACETHRLWSKASVICGDVSKIKEEDIPDTDILLGGFPCQGFSLSGPRKVDDTRNRLYKEYVRIVNADGTKSRTQYRPWQNRSRYTRVHQIW